MKKTVLKFGLISGVMSSVMMLSTMPFIDKLGNWSEILGYTGIVISFLMVFFGIRSFREAHGGVTFGKGLAVGVLIALISSMFYVATWEALYFGMPGMPAKLEQCMVQHAWAAGGDAQAKVREIQQVMELEKIWWKNVAFTFIEPFPIGVLMSFVAAFALRTKKRV